MIKRSYPYRLLLLLIGWHILFLIQAWHSGEIYLKDSYEYLYQAYNLFHTGSWYAGNLNVHIHPDLYSFRPPLYAAFIGCIKGIWNNDFAVILIQNGLSIWNLMLVKKIVISLGADNKRSDVFIMSALIFFPTQLIVANMIMSDILFQTLFLQLFHFACRLYQSPSFRNSFMMAVFASLLMLTKPVFLLGGIVVLLWLGYVFILHKISWKRMFKLALPLFIIPLTIHLVSLQQKHQTGFYHYSSMMAFNQFKFNGRYTLADFAGEEDAEHWADSCNHSLNKITAYEMRYLSMKHDGDSVIKAHPISFIKIYLRGCFVFLLDPGRHDIAIFSNQQEAGFNGLFYALNNQGFSAVQDLMKRISWIQLLALAIITAWNVWMLILLVLFIRSDSPVFVKILLVLLIGYMVTATGILGVARYRTAVFPELILVSMLAIQFTPFLFNRLINENK